MAQAKVKLRGANLIDDELRTIEMCSCPSCIYEDGVCGRTAKAKREYAAGRIETGPALIKVSDSRRLGLRPWED
jgi:hypothetical protein